MDLNQYVNPYEADIRGQETFEHACVALEKILVAYPRLNELVTDTTIPYPAGKIGNVYLCLNCRVGWLHVAGRHHLPDGRLGLGSLFVCDECGHDEIRRR